MIMLNKENKGVFVFWPSISGLRFRVLGLRSLLSRVRSFSLQPYGKSHQTGAYTI